MTQAGNGVVPAANLSTVQGSIKLERNTAAAWIAMKQAAASAGVTIAISSPGGGYRDYAMQQAMIADPSAYGVISGAVLAPAGYSTHGYGTCVDVSTPSANNWIIANGSYFGFVRDRYPAFSYEYNHWHYFGSTASIGNTGVIGDQMHGALIYQCQADPGQPATGLSGAWFLITAVSIINMPAGLGQYLATRLNCDTIAQSQASAGVPFTLSQNGLDYLAAGLGAPPNICETLYVSTTNKVWRAPAGTA